MVRFFTNTRVGRFLTKHIHPLIHPGIPHGLTFASEGKDVFCRMVTGSIPAEVFADQSSIKVSEPTEDSYGISMTATAKRQLEAFDPETRAAIEEAMQGIARRER